MLQLCPWEGLSWGTVTWQTHDLKKYENLSKRINRNNPRCMKGVFLLLFHFLCFNYVLGIISLDYHVADTPSQEIGKSLSICINNAHCVILWEVLVLFELNPVKHKICKSPNVTRSLHTHRCITSDWRFAASNQGLSENTKKLASMFKNQQ